MSEVERIASGLGASLGVSDERMGAVIRLLTDFPSDGKPQDRDARMDALLLGLIASHEVTKPCRECGTARFDYSFMKLTVAGKLFRAALASMPLSPTETAETPNEKSR